jgi:hypothetical protein
MKHMGHRQYYTSVKITGIGDNAKEASAASAKAAKPAAKKTTASKAKKAEE